MSVNFPTNNKRANFFQVVILLISFTPTSARKSFKNIRKSFFKLVKFYCDNAFKHVKRMIGIFRRGKHFDQRIDSGDIRKLSFAHPLHKVITNRSVALSSTVNKIVKNKIAITSAVIHDGTKHKLAISLAGSIRPGRSAVIPQAQEPVARVNCSSRCSALECCNIYCMGKLGIAILAILITCTFVFGRNRKNRAKDEQDTELGNQYCSPVIVIPHQPSTVKNFVVIDGERSRSNDVGDSNFASIDAVVHSSLFERAANGNVMTPKKKPKKHRTITRTDAVEMVLSSPVFFSTTEPLSPLSPVTPTMGQDILDEETQCRMAALIAHMSQHLPEVQDSAESGLDSPVVGSMFPSISSSRSNVSANSFNVTQIYSDPGSSFSDLLSPMRMTPVRHLRRPSENHNNVEDCMLNDDGEGVEIMNSRNINSNLFQEDVADELEPVKSPSADKQGAVCGEQGGADEMEGSGRQHETQKIEREIRIADPDPPPAVASGAEVHAVETETEAGEGAMAGEGADVDIEVEVDDVRAMKVFELKPELNPGFTSEPDPIVSSGKVVDEKGSRDDEWTMDDVFNAYMSSDHLAASLVRASGSAAASPLAVALVDVPADVPVDIAEWKAALTHKANGSWVLAEGTLRNSTDDEFSSPSSLPPAQSTSDRSCYSFADTSMGSSCSAANALAVKAPNLTNLKPTGRGVVWRWDFDDDDNDVFVDASSGVTTSEDVGGSEEQEGGARVTGSAFQPPFPFSARDASEDVLKVPPAPPQDRYEYESPNTEVATFDDYFTAATSPSLKDIFLSGIQQLKQQSQVNHHDADVGGYGDGDGDEDGDGVGRAEVGGLKQRDESNASSSATPTSYVPSSPLLPSDVDSVFAPKASASLRRRFSSVLESYRTPRNTATADGSPSSSSGQGTPVGKDETLAHVNVRSIVERFEDKSTSCECSPVVSPTPSNVSPTPSKGSLQSWDESDPTSGGHGKILKLRPSSGVRPVEDHSSELARVVGLDDFADFYEEQRIPGGQHDDDNSA